LQVICKSYPPPFDICLRQQLAAKLAPASLEACPPRDRDRSKCHERLQLV